MLTFLTLPTRTVTGATSAANTDVVLYCNGTFTVNVYTAVGNMGRALYLQNISNGIITIGTFNGSQLINSTTSYILSSRNQSVILVSDNVSWRTFPNMQIADFTNGRLVIPVGTDKFANTA